jgi:hypothetical protein
MSMYFLAGFLRAAKLFGHSRPLSHQQFPCHFQEICSHAGGTWTLPLPLTWIVKIIKNNIIKNPLKSKVYVAKITVVCLWFQHQKIKIILCTCNSNNNIHQQHQIQQQQIHKKNNNSNRYFCHIYPMSQTPELVRPRHRSAWWDLLQLNGHYYFCSKSKFFHVPDRIWNKWIGEKFKIDFLSEEAFFLDSQLSHGEIRPLPSWFDTKYMGALGLV